MLRNRLVLATSMWRQATREPLPKMPPGDPVEQLEAFELRLVDLLCSQATPTTARDVADKTWDLVHDRGDDDRREAPGGGVPRGPRAAIGSERRSPDLASTGAVKGLPELFDLQGQGALAGLPVRGRRRARPASPSCCLTPSEVDDTGARSCSPASRSLIAARAVRAPVAVRDVAPPRGRGGGHGDRLAGQLRRRGSRCCTRCSTPGRRSTPSTSSRCAPRWRTWPSSAWPTRRCSSTRTARSCAGCSRWARPRWRAS